ncbi:DUF1631 family protein [Undibacterium parvum]|uniref:DUF1631 family protein n=1 Tax=Undibacterium parvum TaxID=401471 RepID=A0A3Q9BNX3_9BURK|nr:DUF1631 family protein [Undibacterium parvum]AZP11183.1 DUF1631 family protein [Undibacterium parvum]
MDNIPLSSSVKKGEASNSSRLLILQALVPIATHLVSSQLEAFSARLTDALFKLSDQTIRPEEASASFQAFQLLKRNNTAFYRLVVGQINAALTKEVSTINAKKKPVKKDAEDFSLVSFDEMESKLLIRNLSQALEVNNADILVALNIRIGNVLRRTPINISQNPFRPDVFVHAVYQAWKEFDATPESHHLVLRLLQPNIFLQLKPILNEINEGLIARGIMPDISDVYRSKGKNSDANSQDEIDDRDPYLHNKLRSIFSGQPISGSGKRTAGSLAWSGTGGGFSGAGNGVGHGGGNAAQANADTVTIDRQFFNYLTSIQKTGPLSEQGMDHDASVQPGVRGESPLRQLSRQAPADSLTDVDQSTIELLARIFDFVFNDPTIPEDIKGLIGQLQIPTLKVALLDKDFFFKETHPARVLIDTLAKSGALLDADATSEDPLYHMIEGVVERVQTEFDEQIDLFSDVVADLEAFLQEEEDKTEEAITLPVETALKQEKMRLAREFAEHDVAIRVETGEVAGFLETFLLEQWIRILTIAHSVKDKKPHALENALKTMDDLIWSLKSKNSAEERKELVSKLPSMLSLLNAWLNAIKWDEPDRVFFFSKLAERHAAIARAPLELSPRRQVEIAVNIAQRASERRLNRHVQNQIDKHPDEWSQQVEVLNRGVWLNFVQANDAQARYKLAWVSPKRTRYIFTNRQGHDAFSISGEELIAKFRSGSVTQIVSDSVVDRALIDALKDPSE